MQENVPENGVVYCQIPFADKHNETEELFHIWRENSKKFHRNLCAHISKFFIQESGAKSKQKILQFWVAITVQSSRRHRDTVIDLSTL